jgi:hypothetical protein
VTETKERGSPPSSSAKAIRPKKLLERPWLWIIAAGIIAGAVFAFGTSLLQSAQDAGGDAGKAFFAVASVGTIAVILMAIVSFYSFRKRRRGLQEHLPGTMMVWLKAHVWLGLAATFAILVHVWLYPWRSGLSSGKVTLVILLVLVASGIAWRIVYVSVPKRVPAAVGNLSVKDTRSRQQQIQVEIEKATAGASDDLRRLAELLLSGKGKPAELDQQALTLSLEEQETWRELKGLAERRDRYRGREPKQERYHRLLQGWKVLHLPLAAVLGAAIVFHVLDVFGVTKKVFASEADAFPDSGQCADCHSDVVREWMLAIHSSAQLTPTTVAQTALALEQDPQIGQVCTNCHAPIGVQIAPSATFPLPGEGGDAILSDGVTCWTCHALPQAPGEIQGAVAGFPVNRAGARSFGTVFNPPLGEELPLPVGDHQVDVGFMGDPLGTFELCGACHNVKVDMADPSDGFSVFGDDVADERVSEFDEEPPSDSDGNGVLDENELQFVDQDGDGEADVDVDGSGKLADLVLQTTFDEWEDFVASSAFGGETCGTCHMPELGEAPTVNDGPGGLDVPERVRHSHEFVGVDYNLEPGHYSGLGVGGGDGREEVLSARDELISQAVTISARTTKVNPDLLRAQVTVRTNFIGHDFPSGFAFARQWWLEVTAETENGDEVCLVPVNPATFAVGDGGNRIVPSACGSGTLNSGSEDLRPCDPQEVAATFADDFAAVGKEPKNATVVLTDRAPLADCDPWLANFQKILTDGDQDEDGRFFEVPYQSLLPDIVKLRTRVADDQLMRPLKPYDNPDTEFDDRSITFEYVFDTSEVRGQRVTVTAAIRLRHLPPYFLRGLDGFYPNGLTSEALLGELIVSTVGEDRTAPKRVPQAGG